MSMPRRAAGAVLLVFLLTGCATASDSRDGNAFDTTAGPTATPGGSMSPSTTPYSATPSGPSGAPPARTPSSSPGKGVGVTTLTGQVELRDIEGGCLVLRVGTTGYQLIGVDRQRARPGTTITVRGRLRPDVATICQVGPVFEVTEIVPG